MIVDFKIKDIKFIFVGEEINSIIEDTDYNDGIYIDLFTNLDDTTGNLIQVRVIKEVYSSQMNLTIRYSTEEEIIEYINEQNNKKNNNDIEYGS
jgi:hypothetical protein